MTPKRSPSDFALFGGAPAFVEKLHVGRPNVGDRAAFLRRVEDILDRRWFTNSGPYVQEFERRIAAEAGVEYCVAMCNATVALEIAARALGFSGEVILPSFTFVATACALMWQEITPVFCDVDPVRHTIDPEKIESLITPRTTGIIGVHVWGQPCNIEAIEEIARRRGLRVLFDAAHALACTHRGRRIGGFGDAEVFSFHATKFLNSFEGGAVVTNDAALAERMRLMRNFGFAGQDNVIHLGTNGKMCEVSAAMGLTCLESMEDIIATNRRNHFAYSEGLASVPGLRLYAFDPAEESNFQYVIVEVDAEQAGLSRDELVRLLHAENVLARRYFYPGCHRMAPFQSYFPHAHLLLPETEKLSTRVMSLPTGTAVGVEEVAIVCDIIRAASRCSPEISTRIRAAS